jgi:hypothetical protein
MFDKKARCRRDFGPSLSVVAVQRLAKNFGVGNRLCDLAMIEVGGEGDETGVGQARAKSLDGVVQPPPGVKDQYTRSRARRRDGEKALWLRLCHVVSLS